MAANTFQLRTNNAAFFREQIAFYFEISKSFYFLGNDGIIVGFFSFFLVILYGIAL